MREITRSQQSRIENVDPIGGHNDFDVLGSFEAVELIKQLQHGSLNFGIAATATLQTRRTDRVNFVHEAS